MLRTLATDSFDRIVVLFAFAFLLEIDLVDPAIDDAFIEGAIPFVVGWTRTLTE